MFRESVFWYFVVVSVRLLLSVHLSFGMGCSEPPMLLWKKTDGVGIWMRGREQKAWAWGDVLAYIWEQWSGLTEFLSLKDLLLPFFFLHPALHFTTHSLLIIKSQLTHIKGRRRKRKGLERRAFRGLKMFWCETRPHDNFVFKVCVCDDVGNRKLFMLFDVTWQPHDILIINVKHYVKNDFKKR